MILKQKELTIILDAFNTHRNNYKNAVNADLTMWFSRSIRNTDSKDRLMLANYEDLMARYRNALREGTTNKSDIVTVISNEPLKPGEIKGAHDLKFTINDLKWQIKVMEEHEGERRQTVKLMRIGLYLALNTLVGERSLLYIISHPILYHKERKLVSITKYKLLALKNCVSESQLTALTSETHRLKDIREITEEGEVFYKGNN